MKSLLTTAHIRKPTDTEISFLVSILMIETITYAALTINLSIWLYGGGSLTLSPTTVNHVGLQRGKCAPEPERWAQHHVGTRSGPQNNKVAQLPRAALLKLRDAIAVVVEKKEGRKVVDGAHHDACSFSDCVFFIADHLWENVFRLALSFGLWRYSEAYPLAALNNVRCDPAATRIFLLLLFGFEWIDTCPEVSAPPLLTLKDAC